MPEQIEDKQHEECYWELQKFLVLALKANPNVLECLYTPLVEHTTPLIDELRGMRVIFLSKLIYQTYNAMSCRSSAAWSRICAPAGRSSRNTRCI